MTYSSGQVYAFYSPDLPLQNSPFLALLEGLNYLTFADFIRYHTNLSDYLTKVYPALYDFVKDCTKGYEKCPLISITRPTTR